MKVTLTHPTNADITVSEDHAKRILAYQGGAGWKMKEDAARANTTQGEGRKKTEKSRVSASD